MAFAPVETGRSITLIQFMAITSFVLLLIGFVAYQSGLFTTAAQQATPATPVLKSDTTIRFNKLIYSSKSGVIFTPPPPPDTNNSNTPTPK